MTKNLEILLRTYIVLHVCHITRVAVTIHWLMVVTCPLYNEHRPPMSRERFKRVSIAQANNTDMHIV